MTHKAWNVRDQTKETLEDLLERKYKEIDGNYKMLKKVSNIEDAKRLVEEIWQMKSFANAIEMELIRREYNNGPPYRKKMSGAKDRRIFNVTARKTKTINLSQKPMRGLS